MRDAARRRQDHSPGSKCMKLPRRPHVVRLRKSPATGVRYRTGASFEDRVSRKTIAIRRLIAIQTENQRAMSLDRRRGTQGDWAIIKRNGSMTLP